MIHPAYQAFVFMAILASAWYFVAILPSMKNVWSFNNLVCTKQQCGGRVHQDPLVQPWRRHRGLTFRIIIMLQALGPRTPKQRHTEEGIHATRG